MNLFFRQCPDEVDLCSETENYSVEENVSPTSTTFPSSTITTSSTSRKLYSREECLHQSAGVGGDIGPRPRRSKRPGTRRKEDSGRSNSVDSGSSEDPQDPRHKASPMVITASLTIPMSGAFTLNLDDPDIPYIEDGTSQQQRKQQTQPQQQHYHQPNAPPRRQRQRSVSGSEGTNYHFSNFRKSTKPLIRCQKSFKNVF